MKLLLADDGPKKAAVLKPFLQARGVLEERDVYVAETGVEARELLRSLTFDLLVLDILLPWRTGDDPSAQGSAALLDVILYDDDVRRPRQIVGLTADDEAAQRADPYFASHMWTVLRFDETSNAWMEAIAASVKYMREQRAAPPEYGTDLLIITALREPEMDAVHRLPWAWTTEEPLDDATFIRRGTFQSAGKAYSVVSTVADRMGMVSAAVLAAKAIAMLKPRFCVMAGVCAGIAKHTRLGDVILADPSWDYQSGKRIRENDGTQSFKIAPHQLAVSQLVRSRVKQLSLDRELLDQIRRSRDDDPGHDLRLLVGPIATGSAVLADDAKVVEVQDQQRDVFGIEMEIYGIYSAAAHAGLPKPTAFAMKGVCDFADEHKEDSFQRYAAYTSARLVKAFFERYMNDLYEKAGQ